MVLKPPEWLRERLGDLRWRRRRQQQQPLSGLGSVPTKIILIIATYLKPSGLISLALTCRSLYRLCFPGRLHLETQEKEELLMSLEKDGAGLYFCHYCTKLLRWDTRWDNPNYPWPAWNLPCRTHLVKNMVLYPYTSVHYQHARLCMNRNFYGAPHGLPLHTLEKQHQLAHSFVSAHRRIKEIQTLHARIVEDQLLIPSTKTTSHTRGDSRALRYYIESEIFKVCMHLTTESVHRFHPRPRQLSELVENQNTASGFVPFEQSCGSCPICLTDYCIDVVWNGRAKGFTVKSMVYRQLGDCRSPRDGSWRTMMERHLDVRVRVVFQSEYRPRTIRDRWNKFDSIESKTSKRMGRQGESGDLARINKTLFS